MTCKTVVKTGMVIALVSSIVVACGGSSDESEQASSEAVAKDHVWQDQVDALDKAQETEDALLKAQQERAKQLDADP